MGDLADTKMVWDGAVIAEMLHGPNGLVAKHLLERATVVQSAAKLQVGVKTGRLRAAIVKRPVDEGSELAVMVGTDTVPYAAMHHEGTEPHVIRPVKAKVLAFPVGGKTVFATVVHHPGTKPNHYLSDNLHHAIQ